MAYTQIKTKYDALKQELAHLDRSPAGVNEKGTAVRPRPEEKRFTLVSDSEKQDQQR